MSRIVLFFLVVMLSVPALAQQLFHLDFEDEFLPDGWEGGDLAEWGRILGEDGGNYFRFHPASWMDALQSPELDLTEGHYTLYYSWNEAAVGNPDFCDIRLRKGMQAWQSLDRIGEGNNRTWQKDSTVLGVLDQGSYTLEFAYTSTVRFPSQYLNLDNIYLLRRDVVTAVEELVDDGNIKVYPNPAGDILKIRSDLDDDLSWEVSLLNISGQHVLDLGMLTGKVTMYAEVTQLSPGVYFIKFQQPDFQMHKMIVIQH